MNNQCGTKEQLDAIRDVLKGIVEGKGGYTPSPKREESQEEIIARLEETPRTPEDNM